MKNPRSLFRLATAVFCLAGLTAAQTTHAGLKAGANVTDITPPPAQFPISVTGSLARMALG